MKLISLFKNQTISHFSVFYRGTVSFFSGISFNRIKLLFKFVWRNKIKREVIPEHLTLGVTYKCQCRCVHCSSNIPNLTGENFKNELSADDVKSSIYQAVELGIPRITFFGGEPLMRLEIYEFISYANKLGMITKINTNGLWLNKKTVEKLKAAGLNHCDVSIDDPNPRIHDKLRGVPGTFQKAISGIKLLKHNKILCQIVTYAARRNITAGLEKIIDLGKKLKVDSVSIVFPMATGCWADSYGELLNEQEKRRVRKLVDYHFVVLEIPTEKCSCQVVKKKSVYIAPDGGVTPCPFIPWQFGNIKEKTLEFLLREYYRKQNIKFKGDCIMNSTQNRNYIKNTISSVRQMRSA